MFLNQGVAAFSHKFELKEIRARQWKHGDDGERAAGLCLLAWAARSAWVLPALCRHTKEDRRFALGATHSSKGAIFFTEPGTKPCWVPGNWLTWESSTLWGRTWKRSHAEKKLAWILASALLVSCVGAACSRASDSVEQSTGLREENQPAATKEARRWWFPHVKLRKAKWQLNSGLWGTQATESRAITTGAHWSTALETPVQDCYWCYWINET